MPNPFPARLALVALAGLALLAACAGPKAASPPPGSAASGAAPSSAANDSAVVLEVRLRRSAELSDNRGALRVLDQDLNVQYRLRGKGSGLDAGEVTFDGAPMNRSVSGKGAVSYRVGRAAEGGDQAGGDAWSTIANSGGPRVPALQARVKLAPFPLVTQPSPWLGVSRSAELPVVMLPPLPDIWFRVTLSGSGETVTAYDMGEGRWLFPLGQLDSLGTGRARLLIEVETSCGSCPGPGGLRLNWSSHSELEIPLTLF